MRYAHQTDRGDNVDIDANVRRYLDGGAGSGARTANARYSSFDYCFNYFQAFRERGDAAALASPEHIQLSCLQLGFYLASWGMLRGSAELLQKSARSLSPVIAEVANAEDSLWKIDLDSYDHTQIHLLIESAGRIRRANGGMSDTLVTKVMLGVFGNVPAFDTNFRRGCGVTTFGPKALQKIQAFYKANAGVIDKHRVRTLDFVTGKPTHRAYTRAKVVDMHFFIEGM
jgi:hypothetical protein